MSEFCYDCIRTVFPRIRRDRNDLRHSSNEPVYDVCEGCGPGWFDKDGKRVPDEAQTNARTP